MSTYVEHANVTVKNVDRTIEFLQTALPDFKIRHFGHSHYRWCHIGTEETYIALQEVVEKESVDRSPYVDVGINHIGFVVDDIEEVERRLLSNGYKQNPMETKHPYRKRLYFYDSDGLEWEFIQYLTHDSKKRNDYDH